MVELQHQLKQWKGQRLLVRRYQLQQISVMEVVAECGKPLLVGVVALPVVALWLRSTTLKAPMRCNVTTSGLRSSLAAAPVYGSFDYTPDLFNCRCGLAARATFTGAICQLRWTVTSLRNRHTHCMTPVHTSLRTVHSAHAERKSALWESDDDASRSRIVGSLPSCGRVRY